MTHKMIIKAENGYVIDVQVGSKEALSAEAKRLRAYYKHLGVRYKILVVKRK